MVLSQAISNELIAIKIPPRPAILLNIQKEMRAAVPDLKAIEKVISLDVGISAALVKIANSPVFGAHRNAGSIRKAMQVLGLDAVATAVSALALRQCFAKVPNLERFWDSSARIAQLSGWLAARLARPGCAVNQEEAFTFGLFRDCGIPILLSMYADYFDILKMANEESTRPFTAIEQDELDVDHAMIGGMLVREWELPAAFRSAVEIHHERDALAGDTDLPEQQAARRMIAIAQLAEYLFQQLTGLNKTNEWAKLGDACMTILGLEAGEMDDLLAAAEAAGVHTSPMI